MTETSALRHLLLKLKHGAWLRLAGGAYLVSGKRGPKMPVAAALVEAAVAAGLIAPAGERFCVTAAGERWLVGGDPALAQHLELETRLIRDEAGNEHYVVVDAAESPLSALRRRGVIGVVAFEAGEKLRRDYTLGRLSPRLGVDYSAPVGARGYRQSLTETVVAARQRFNAAMAAAGPGLNAVLFDVCCYLTSLDDCEKSHAWPRGSARVVLTIALDRLARHYGMAAPAAARTRVWRQED